MSAAERVDPDPGALIESMRAFGYSLATAIADLIDNSVAADATTIDVRLTWAGRASAVAVIDDGAGMDSPTLIDAMRLGSRSPTERRAPGDLGRFGLGLKSAAWSQGRSLTVLTRTAQKATIRRRWDLDHVTRTRRWELLDDISPTAEQLEGELTAMVSGTAVLVEDLDRLVGETDIDDEPARDRFYRATAAVARHIGVVFHRFLSGRDALVVRVNGEPVEPWDPFLEAHPATQQLPTERLTLHGRAVDVTAFVLPHHTRLTADQHERAAGPGGWSAQQGFYIYRARRLLVAGGWMGLPRMQREEHNKLARVRVDLDNTMDEEWQIDVRKATARVPGPLQPHMERIARAARRRAGEVYRFRGKQEARRTGTRSSLNFVWLSAQTRAGRRFTINREHPTLKGLRADPARRAAIDAALRVIEEHIPVEAIVGHALEHPNDTLAAFADRDHEVERILRDSLGAMTATGTPPIDALSALAQVEPFDEFPHIIQTLSEELRA